MLAKRRSRRPTVWPAADQELLLRAALLPGEAGRTAWQEWRHKADPAVADAASSRLLPLAAHNLGATLPGDPVLERGRQLALVTWARNQALLAAARPAIAALQAADIPVLLLKGASLAPTAYGSLSLRPMSDVDVLVPTAEAERARALMTAAHFEPSYWMPPARLELVHALGYRDRAGNQIDLHWHALWECCQPDADADLWRRAVPLRVGPLEVLALMPADQLLQVVAHGLRWSEPTTVHWVADLVLLLRGHGRDLDWNGTAERAAARGLSLQLQTALSYVADRFEAPVPAAAFDALRNRPVRAGERLEMALRMRGPGLVRGLLLHWFDHQRLAGTAPPPRRILGFASHLRAAWGLRSVGELPGTAAAKIARRLRARRSPGSFETPVEREQAAVPSPPPASREAATRPGSGLAAAVVRGRGGKPHPAGNRRGIVVFLEDKRNLMIQFGGLYTSLEQVGSRDTDLIVFGPRAALDKVPDDCVKVEYEAVSSAPEWRNYHYINSISCLAGEEAAVLADYDYLLRSDVDTFLTPAWNRFYPERYTVGGGGYVNDQDTRDRLRRIATRHGLEHRGIHNIGSTHYGPAPQVREVCRVAMQVAMSILTDEFPDGEGQWPGWYAGVTLLYATEIAVNGLVESVDVDPRRLDFYSTSAEPVADHPHIHCWHTDDLFSKFHFLAGRYDDAEVKDAAPEIVRDYCLQMALLSRQRLPSLSA